MTKQDMLVVAITWWFVGWSIASNYIGHSKAGAIEWRPRSVGAWLFFAVWFFLPLGPLSVLRDILGTLFTFGLFGLLLSSSKRPLTVWLKGKRKGLWCLSPFAYAVVFGAIVQSLFSPKPPMFYGYFLGFAMFLVSTRFFQRDPEISETIEDKV